MDPRLFNAATYGRVSTVDKQNLEAQTAELRRYCAARGWIIVEEATDRGLSGSTGPQQRPGLARLMEAARSCQIEVVVVTKLDRLFRSLKHLITTLDELQALGVMFVSIGDQIDLTTAGGRLMMQIIGAFGEFERGLIRERTVAGLAHAKSKGRRLGRPRTRPDAEILNMRAIGASYSEIERKLGCNRSAIYRALQAVSKTQSKSAFQLAEKTRHRNGP